MRAFGSRMTPVRGNPLALLELGIHDSKLAEAIEGGPLDAPIADAKLHKMERRDFAPKFPLEWALKDVGLSISAAGGDACSGGMMLHGCA